MEWLLEQQAVDSSFLNKIFSNETHFALGGCVNKQNCCIWGSENPQVNEEMPLEKVYPEKVYPEKLSVWYALRSEGVIESYFFENDESTTVTVNSERYMRHIITDFFSCCCWRIRLGEYVDSTTHTTPANMALLQGAFSGHVKIMWFDTIKLLLWGCVRLCFCR